MQKLADINLFEKLGGNFHTRNSWPTSYVDNPKASYTIDVQNALANWITDEFREDMQGLTEDENKAMLTYMDIFLHKYLDGYGKGINLRLPDLIKDNVARFQYSSQYKPFYIAFTKFLKSRKDELERLIPDETSGKETQDNWLTGTYNMAYTKGYEQGLQHKAAQPKQTSGKNGISSKVDTRSSQEKLQDVTQTGEHDDKSIAKNGMFKLDGINQSNQLPEIRDNKRTWETVVRKITVSLDQIYDSMLKTSSPLFRTKAKDIFAQQAPKLQQSYVDLKYIMTRVVDAITTQAQKVWPM